MNYNSKGHPGTISPQRLANCRARVRRLRETKREPRPVVINCRIDLDTYSRMIDYAEEHNVSFGSWLRGLMKTALQGWLPEPPEGVNGAYNHLDEPICWPCAARQDNGNHEFDYFLEAECAKCGREIVGDLE